MHEDVIDQTVVDELVEGIADGDPGLFLELVAMFASDGPRRATRIAAAARTGDLETVEHEVHALRGAAGNLGALQVASLAEALQVSSRRQDHAEVARLAAEIEARLEASVLALQMLADGYR